MQDEFGGWREFGMRIAPLRTILASEPGHGAAALSEPLWTTSITQNPAKYNSSRLVAILINFPLRLDTDDEPDGVAFAPGSISGGIDTPSGRVVFIDGRHRATQI